jgi:aspartyl-tRNA(Asn)/glutamyl-tRNA(Gln) amidotransferase subunit A
VAAGLAAAALGTDTGGSIRQPAALTGTVGVKPTYGRVSRYGVIAFASSLDQVGPIARTVEDAALVLEAIAGHDPLDATSIPEPAPRCTEALGRGVAGLKVGVPDEYFIPGMEPEVEQAVRAAIDELARLGAEVVRVSLPHTRHAVAAYYLIAPAEASSNLARYDGVRYGHRAAGATDLLALYRRTRAEGFGPEVKRRIMLGTYALRSGYYDAYYGQAQRVRTLVARDFADAFQRCDVLATPTSPTVAWPLGAKSDPLALYLADVFTIACNLAGLPGLSLPCGWSRAGLPIGLQLLGRPLAEPTLFRVASAYEAATGHRTRRPTLG